MTDYTIGVDISKALLDVHLLPGGKERQFANNRHGFRELIKWNGLAPIKWRQGFDEMDEVSSSGSAELLDNGKLEIEFTYHNGDQATLYAKPAPFSVAC